MDTNQAGTRGHAGRQDKNITTVCIGKPHFNLFKVILSTTIFKRLLNSLSASNVDLVILS